MKTSPRVSAVVAPATLVLSFGACSEDAEGAPGLGGDKRT